MLSSFLFTIAASVNRLLSTTSMQCVMGRVCREVYSVFVYLSVTVRCRVTLV